MSCCSAVRAGSTRSTWAADSSPNRCAAIREWCRWSGPTPATWPTSSLPEPIALAVIDVSFISLGLVLGPVASTLAHGGQIVALVKPQFEAGRGRTDHGVVRDPAVHREVLERVVAAASALRIGTRAVTASPLTGPEGNREFLVQLAPGPGCAEIGERIAEAIAT